MNKLFLQKRLYATLAFLFVAFTSLAQDGEGLDVEVEIGEDEMWYQNPLYWVIAALVLIIIVVLVTRNSSKAE